MAPTLLLLTFATIVLTATSLTFTLFLLAALFINHWASAGLAVATAVLDILDIIWIAYPFVVDPRGLRDATPLRRRPRFWTVIGLAIAAHVLTAALLTWTQMMDRLPDNIFGSSWQGILHASWGLMAASIICHVVYLHAIRPRRSIELNDDRFDASMPYASSTYGEGRAMVLQNMSPSQCASHQSSSPSSSKTGKDPSKATTQEVQPHHDTSSQTHLIRPLSDASSFHSQPYRPSCNSTTDLESDTTTPERSPSMHSHSELFPARPSTPVKQRLEPIPGSAANSPGRALDIADPTSNSDPQPTSASASASHTAHQRSRSTSPQTPAADASPIDESRIPPRFRTRKNSVHTPHTQRPQSPTIELNESHIHPLFRSDSPLPPPAPAFNTTVVASAFGGRTMSKEDLPLAHSWSRPGSPVTRSSMTRSRNGSFSRSRPRTPNRHTSEGRGSPSRERDMDVPPVPRLLDSPKLD